MVFPSQMGINTTNMPDVDMPDVDTTDAKGKKLDDPTRDAHNAQRAAEREANRERRSALLLSFSY